MTEDVNALAFDSVSYTYPGQGLPALNDVTLHLPARLRIAILGRNGSGKSTLFLHCNGILRPDVGTVYLDCRPVTYGRRDLNELRRRVGIVFQHAEDQLLSASVTQDISFGPLNLGLDEEEIRNRVAEAAKQCELNHLLDRPTHALSGGEKARVALAGVLAMRPDILLIDEPTANLDPWMRRQIFTIFHALHGQGKTIILATHEVDVARHWADFVVVMQEGRVLAADEPDVIFANESLVAETGLAEPWYLPRTR